MEKINSRWAKLAVIIAGSFLYTFGMNYFLIPYGLYSGGGIGIAQVITYLLGKVIDFGGKNVYGIVYFLINIPLLVLAWKGIGKSFLIKYTDRLSSDQYICKHYSDSENANR